MNNDRAEQCPYGSMGCQRSRLVAARVVAKAVLGFNRRSKEIVRIIKENNADMLVIGAHGHRGIKDWFYGQTIDSVRHELNIPVLVVNV